MLIRIGWSEKIPYLPSRLSWGTGGCAAMSGGNWDQSQYGGYPQQYGYGYGYQNQGQAQGYGAQNFQEGMQTAYTTQQMGAYGP